MFQDLGTAVLFSHAIRRQGSGALMTLVSLILEDVVPDESATQTSLPRSARIAAIDDRHGAPVSPREPPATSTWPEANFVDSAPRRG